MIYADTLELSIKLGQKRDNVQAEDLKKNGYARIGLAPWKSLYGIMINNRFVK